MESVKVGDRVVHRALLKRPGTVLELKETTALVQYDGGSALWDWIAVLRRVDALEVGDRIEMVGEGSAVEAGARGTVTRVHGREGYSVRWDESPELLYLREDLRRVDGPLVALAKSHALPGGGVMFNEGDRVVMAPERCSTIEQTRAVGVVVPAPSPSLGLVAVNWSPSRALGSPWGSGGVYAPEELRAVPGDGPTSGEG